MQIIFIRFYLFICCFVLFICRFRLFLYLILYIFLIFVIISLMFRDFPGCSRVFYVPDFVDGR